MSHELSFQIWEFNQDILIIRLFQFSQCGVFQRLYSCSSLASIYQSDLAKILSRPQLLNDLLIFLFIDNTDLACAFRDNVHVLGIIELCHQNGLGLLEIRLEFLNHDRNNFFELNVNAHFLLNRLFFV
jgi:hypothetical protein